MPTPNIPTVRPNTSAAGIDAICVICYNKENKQSAGVRSNEAKEEKEIIKLSDCLTKIQKEYSDKQIATILEQIKKELDGLM